MTDYREKLIDEAISHIHPAPMDDVAEDGAATLPGDIVRSDLQKSIRRAASTETRSMAQHLWASQQKSYCWNTLATIVIEDVGPGNTLLCALVSACLRAPFRARLCLEAGLDQRSMFIALCCFAAKCVKDRSFCELSVLADTAIKIGPLWGDISTDDLFGILNETVADVEGACRNYRAVAALRARARNGNTGLLSLALKPIIQGSNADGYKSVATALMFETPVDPMCYAAMAVLSVAGSSMLDSHELSWDLGPDAWHPKAHVIHLSALDGHTELGRKAIQRFVSHYLNEFKGLPLSKSQLNFAVGKYLFFEEGAYIAKSRQLSKLCWDIRERQQLEYYGKTYKSVSVWLPVVSEVVREEYATLNAYRQELLDGL